MSEPWWRYRLEPIEPPDDALEHKSELHPAFVDARALIAAGFTNNTDGVK